VRQEVSSQGSQKRDGTLSKEGVKVTSWETTEWQEPSQLLHLQKQIHSEGPLRAETGVFNIAARHRRCLAAKRLETVHPNPGPVRRGWRTGRKTEEKRRGRRERRYAKRREKRSGKKKGSDTEELRVATWNLQGVSLRENNRDRLRRACTYIKEQGWEVVLVSEVRAEQDGVIWLGEEEELTAIIHSRKAAVVLRGKWLDRWISDKQKMAFTERTATVVIGDVRLVAVYQPVWDGGERVEIYREEVERQVALSPEK
jgi:hypothetical protein